MSEYSVVDYLSYSLMLWFSFSILRFIAKCILKHYNNIKGCCMLGSPRNRSRGRILCALVGWEAKEAKLGRENVKGWYVCARSLSRFPAELWQPCRAISNWSKRAGPAYPWSDQLFLTGCHRGRSSHRGCHILGRLALFRQGSFWRGTQLRAFGNQCFQ